MFSTTDKLGPSQTTRLEAFKSDSNLLLLSEIAVISINSLPRMLCIITSQRKNSKEAFRGFINLFDDYLATDLFDKVDAPIQLIWGEKDPWESLNEAREWKKQFRNIKRLDIIFGAGHCPHDEEPEQTNSLMNEFIQETK